LDDDQREYVARKLGMKLGKCASSIERVSVRVTDVNDPRGGADQRCRVKVVMSGLPSVVVERQQATREAAIDTALHATEESVRRIVRRRRMKWRHRHAARKDSLAA
jgi:ribosome-associated translation inhibitor RaiA